MPANHGPNEGAPRYRHVASLGSSFAAGPGIEPIVDTAAMRSGRNCAHLLAEALGASLTDLSISGATTSTIVDTPQRMLHRKFAPQVDGLPAGCDLITITAGGNDLNYARSLLKAGWAGWFRSRGLTRWLGKRMGGNAVPHIGPAEIEGAAAGLTRVVAAARARCPHARIVLVDYLTVIGADTAESAESPFKTETLEGFRRVGTQLAEAFELAAARSGADLVKVSAASADHGVGSIEPWVVGFQPGFRGIPAFHPNAAGMQAVARQVGEFLDGAPGK